MVYVICPYTKHCIKVQEIDCVDTHNYAGKVLSKSNIDLCISNTAFNMYSSGYVPKEHRIDWSDPNWTSNCFFHNEPDRLTLNEMIGAEPPKMTKRLAKNILVSIMSISGKSNFDQFLDDLDDDISEKVSLIDKKIKTSAKKEKPREFIKEPSEETISDYCKSIDKKRDQIKAKRINYFEYKKDPAPTF